MYDVYLLITRDGRVVLTFKMTTSFRVARGVGVTASRVRVGRGRALTHGRGGGAKGRE